MNRLNLLSGVLLTAALVAGVSGGCGYTLQGNLPGDLKTVSVPVFKNRTTEAGAETHHLGGGQCLHHQWPAAVVA
jgi:hypothetical protein